MGVVMFRIIRWFFHTPVAAGANNEKPCKTEADRLLVFSRIREIANLIGLFCRGKFKILRKSFEELC